MCISYFSNLSFSWCSFKYNFVHQPIEFFGDNWFFIHMKMHRENCPPLPKMIYPGTNIIYVPDICLLFMYEFCSIKFISWLFMHWLWIFLGFLYFQYRYFSSNYGENHPCQQASHPGLSVYIYTSTHLHYTAFHQSWWLCWRCASGL